MHNHEFKKKFGQNFLKTFEFAQRIVDSLDPTTKSVIEVGPGDGKLTELLLQKGLSVFSVEIDKSLYPLLEAKFGDNPNFTLVKSDIMLVNPKQLIKTNYSLIGSLPYNISKPIISKFLREEKKPDQMILLIQKEVAQDYTAQPPRSTFLANYASIFGTSKYLFTIPKEEFYPTPKVDGGVFKIDIQNQQYDEKFVKFIKSGFLTPRKTLSNNLSATLRISKTDVETEFESLGINPKVRPAEVSLSEWKFLYENLKLSQLTKNIQSE